MTQSHSTVSIIIPVYQVAPYLNNCLDSVVNQSYKHIEIVLVDDGSTDGSGKLCDEWAKKDSRIKVIHKKNAGLNMARFSGFEIATGDYITFLDSDDLFHIDTIKNTLSILKKENVDAVIYQFMEFSDEDEKMDQITPIISDDYDVKKDQQSIFQLLISNTYEHLYPMTAWGKLYKRNLIEAVDWSKSNFKAFEDNFFTPQIFDKIRSFVVLKQQLYLYRRNTANTSVLSKTVTGNHRNGQPVGYLEYINLLRDFWNEFLKKHDIPLDEELQEFWLSNMIFRFDNLIEANAICLENNVQYIPELIEYLLHRYGRDLEKKQQEISRLTDENEALRLDLKNTQAELKSISTLGGYIKNTGRRIKRRITKKPS